LHHRNLSNTDGESRGDCFIFIDTKKFIKRNFQAFAHPIQDSHIESRFGRILAGGQVLNFLPALLKLPEIFFQNWSGFFYKSLIALGAFFVSRNWRCFSITGQSVSLQSDQNIPPGIPGPPRQSPGLAQLEFINSGRNFNPTGANRFLRKTG